MAPTTHAAEARRQKGRFLAEVLAPTTLDDPDILVADTIPAGLFWEVVAALATERLRLRVNPPTGPEGRAAVIDAVKAKRRVADRNDGLDDVFRGFPREVR